MNEAITHLKVPVEREDRDVCLGANGSVAHVARVLRMITARWKLPILFRLFAEPSIRTSQFMRDIPDISQKMLTQHLRELEDDGLVARRDFDERPPRVEYSLTLAGRGLMPVLMSVREFSRDYPMPSESQGLDAAKTPIEQHPKELASRQLR
jgi:DNA-binding HxlR family transcriptional regulator